MIHRAIFGSLERFIAIITEHYGGKWPLWLSPRQAIVCSLGPRHADYCKQVHQQLRAHRWEVDLDISQDTLKKKVRNAETLQYNYILVAGDQEVSLGELDVRRRDGVRLGKKSVGAFEKIMVDDFPADVPLPQRLYKNNVHMKRGSADFELRDSE